MQDLPTIYKMQQLGTEIIQNFKENTNEPLSTLNLEFKCGFHAIPSMNHLHLHVISTDMESPHMKTKRHYLSFSTNFFITVEDVIKLLSEDSRVKLNGEEYEKLLKGNLISPYDGQNFKSSLKKFKVHLSQEFNRHCTGTKTIKY